MNSIGKKVNNTLTTENVEAKGESLRKRRGEVGLEVPEKGRRGLSARV